MKVIIFILIIANLFALLIHSEKCNDILSNDPKVDQNKFKKAKDLFRPKQLAVILLVAVLVNLIF